jgi:hypothetical protein
MQESVGNIVVLSQEPLGVFLDALLKEEGAVMLCSLDVDLLLDWVRILTNNLPKVGLMEPAHGRGAVRHQEGTAPYFQTASQHVGPRQDDGHNVLKEVVGHPKT